MHPEPFDTAFSKTIYEERYKKDDDENWLGTTDRVIGSVTGELFKAPHAQKYKGEILEAQDRLRGLMGSKRFIPGGRYLYAAGRDFHQVNNCLLLRCPDSREGFADTSWQSEMALMTGAGIGVWYGDVRAAGKPISRTGGIAAGPVPKMCQVNDTGRHVIAGGNRRSAIWAGLPWWHSDIFSFITAKDWSDDIRRLKAKAAAEGEEFPAKMDKTNISVTLDDAFFDSYLDNSWNPKYTKFVEAHGEYAPDGTLWYAWAHKVYDAALAHMLKHGEPGFTVDVGHHADEVLRNACTEITSADDSDVCNLGSLVLPRFSTPEKFGEAVRDSVLFLTAGSEYSLVPYEKVAEVRTKNRRLGLGLIGVHEFLMQNGVRYGTDEALEVLEPYLDEYARALEYANEQQSTLGYSLSIAATAVAPTGTIGSLADSTPGGDPMFSAAEIRVVISASPDGDARQRHVVVDPTAARLVAKGVDLDVIEDAYTLSMFPERRLRQQAFLQAYTDHAISSTVNIHAPITELPEIRDFGNTLMKVLPDIRGITVYPDGAIAGQPRTPVDLAWALEQEGRVLEAKEEVCVGGLCGV